MSEKTNMKTQTQEEKTGTEAAFDREEWVRQKRAERKHAFDTIDQMSGLVGEDGPWLKLYLDVQSRFPAYSVGNVLLIAAQKPDAVRLADVSTWNAQGENVRKGETGIMILEPSGEYTREDGTKRLAFNPKKLFDISQTTAKAEPEPDRSYDGRELLRALVSEAPCDVLADDGSRLPGGECARYDPEERCVFVARDREPEELFRAITRELAHAHMDGPEYTREACEFRALCAAYIVCRRSGVEVSADLVSPAPESFAGLSPRGVRRELREIRETANAITRDMARSRETLREEVRDTAR